MSEERERVYEECQLTDVDFLTKTFKDGINVTKENFTAFLKTATGRSIEECFPDMSVMFTLNFGNNKRYSLGYYDVPDSPLFTINMIDIDNVSEEVGDLVKEWLRMVDYGPHHALLASVGDIYASMNDIRSWTVVDESKESNDLISMVALAMSVVRNIDMSCGVILEREKSLRSLFVSLVDYPQYKDGFLAAHANVTKILQRAHFCFEKISELEFPEANLVRIKAALKVLSNALESVEQIRTLYEGPKEPATFSNIDSFSVFVGQEVNQYPDLKAEPEIKPSPISVMMPCPPGIH